MYTVITMNHQTLYRKYRPKSLDTVRGQESVVTLFRNVLRDNKISHAYLFFGGRGTGKTSVARIIARELGISESDTYEIDAASNRGIDEIRILRDGVNTLPFDSKYKVYIIDEAHMLTIQASNALLKTLEEPPAHCIFILATTDPEKLPSTIRSRCQMIEFKKATQQVLSEMINDTAQHEGYSIDSQVVSNIAIRGDGSYRDTYGILENLFSLSTDKKITLEDYSKAFGESKDELSIKIVESITKGNTENALDLLNECNSNDMDSLILLESIIGAVRKALLLRFDTSGKYRQDLMNTMDSNEIDKLKEIGLSKVNPLTSDTIIELVHTHSSIKNNTFASGILLEAVIIKLCTTQNETKR